jgi:hypothetical protein
MELMRLENLLTNQPASDGRRLANQAGRALSRAFVRKPPRRRASRFGAAGQQRRCAQGFIN